MSMIASIFLAVALQATPIPADVRPCTRQEAITAEAVTDYLDSWSNVHKFFKQFGHCYDGGVADGANAKIHALWAEQWAQLPKMIALTKKDESFRKFLWQRIADEDFTQEEFAAVLRQARENCPAGAGSFCDEVIRVSKLARVPPS